MVVASDALSLSTIQGLGTLANRLIVVSPFPPISAASQYPGLEQFKKDMAAELASGDKDAAGYQTYDRAVAVLGYFGVIAVADLAGKGHFDTSAALKQALNSTTKFDLGGVIPPWSPNKSVSTVYPRASNDAFYEAAWDNGTLKMLSSAPIHVAKYVDQTNS
jgi:hypothetical protein